MAHEHQGASIIIERDNGSVLLMLRDDKPTIPEPNKWDLPGGWVEPGETPLECIVREMKEELELAIDESQVTRFLVSQLPDRVEHTFHARVSLDVLTQPLHEGQRIQYFSAPAVAALARENQIAFGFGRVLTRFFNTKKKPE